MEYLVDILPSLSEDGPWIAGGSLFRTKLLFFKNETQLSEYKNKVKSSYEEKQFQFLTDSNSRYAYNLFIKYMGKNYKIQLITRKFYEGPCKVLDDFDLNICQLAYDGKSLYVAEDTLPSIENKNIGVNKVSDAASVMRRCIKYAQIGFTMSDSDIAKFFSIVAKNYSVNPESLIKKEKTKEEYGALE